MNEQEVGSIKLLKLKQRRRDQIIQIFCRIGSPSEIWFPLFSLYKFQKSDKNSSNSFRTQGNLMKSKEFASRKLLKLKYRMGDQLIKTFYKNVSSEK